MNTFNQEQLAIINQAYTLANSYHIATIVRKNQPTIDVAFNSKGMLEDFLEFSNITDVKGVYVMSTLTIEWLNEIAEVLISDPHGQAIKVARYTSPTKHSRETYNSMVDMLKELDLPTSMMKTRY